MCVRKWAWPEQSCVGASFALMSQRLQVRPDQMKLHPPLSPSSVSRPLTDGAAVEGTGGWSWGSLGFDTCPRHTGCLSLLLPALRLPGCGRPGLQHDHSGVSGGGPGGGAGGDGEEL